MAANTQHASIAPHTEYTHTHVRCLDCGDTVPAEATDGPRCERCVGGVT